MNVVRALPIPGWRWVLCALAVGIAVSVAFPAYGAISGKRWITGEYPSEAAFEGTGTMWSRGYYSKIIAIQHSTDTITTWSHANTAILGTGYGSSVLSGSDFWTVGDNLPNVNRMNITNGQLTTWALPTADACGVRDLAVDSAGLAWFGKSDSKVASIDPATNTLTEWPMPTAGAYCPAVFAVEGSGATQKVWFCTRQIDKIGYLAPSSGTVTEWTIPGNPPDFTTCAAPNASGQIWFSNAQTSIRRLDTQTNNLNVWPCQVGCAAIAGNSTEVSGKVWLADGTDLIRFDPVAGEFIEYTGLSCSSNRPFVDSGGNIWTTYHGGGTVCRFPPPP